MMQYQLTLFVLLTAALAGAANFPTPAPKLVQRQETTLSLDGSPYLTLSSGEALAEPTYSDEEITTENGGTTWVMRISSDGYSMSAIGKNRATTGAMFSSGSAAGSAAASSSAGSNDGIAAATTSAHSGAASRSVIEASKLALLCATAVSTFIALVA